MDWLEVRVGLDDKQRMHFPQCLADMCTLECDYKPHKLHSVHMCLGMGQHIYYEDRPYLLDNQSSRHIRDDSQHMDRHGIQVNMNTHRYHIVHSIHMAMDSKDLLGLDLFLEAALVDNW